MNAWWPMTGDKWANRMGVGDVVLALDKALENTDLLHGRWVNVVVFLDVKFFFFYIPLFAFRLIEQMEILLLNYPVSPFDPSTSGRGLFTYIFFFNASENWHGIWGGILSFFPLSVPSI